MDSLGCSEGSIYYKWSGRKKFKDKFNSIFSDNDEHLQITTNLFILIEIAVWAVIILAFWDIFLVHQKVKDFGQWGDFFGGVLNPILTFLTFVGLMITIILQQIELKESRVEFTRTADALNKQEQHMQIQTFENTFFKMLELHNNIVENLKYTEQKRSRNSNGLYKGVDDISYIGREIFKVLFDEFKRNNGIWYPINTYKHKIQTEQNHVLGQYFRNLYQILKFIKQQENILDKNLQNYANILRAQLSSYELIFLFLNCFKHVSDSGQFKELLIGFSFLQHFPVVKTERISIKRISGRIPDYQIFYKDKKDDHFVRLTFNNDTWIIIGEQALAQYYTKNKSAFDGNDIMLTERVLK